MYSNAAIKMFVLTLYFSIDTSSADQRDFFAFVLY